MTTYGKRAFLCPSCHSVIKERYLTSTSSWCWEDGIVPDDAFSVPSKVECSVCGISFLRDRLTLLEPEAPLPEKTREETYAEEHSYRLEVIRSYNEWLDYYGNVHDWMSYRVTLTKLADVCLRDTQWKEALELYLEAIYFDMNGYDVDLGLFVPAKAIDSYFIFGTVINIQTARRMSTVVLNVMFSESASRLSNRFGLPLTVELAQKKFETFLSDRSAQP